MISSQQIVCMVFIMLTHSVERYRQLEGHKSTGISLLNKTQVFTILVVKHNIIFRDYIRNQWKIMDPDYECNC